MRPAPTLRIEPPDTSETDSVRRADTTQDSATCGVEQAIAGVGPRRLEAARGSGGERPLGSPWVPTSKAGKVDVEVILPHGKGILTHKGVTANQVLKVKQ